MGDKKLFSICFCHSNGDRKSDNRSWVANAIELCLDLSAGLNFLLINDECIRSHGSMNFIVMICLIGWLSSNETLRAP